MHEINTPLQKRNHIRTTLVTGILAVTLIASIQALAGLASNDLAGQLRATPQATMGALEAVSNVVAIPNTPSGLSLDVI